jgi:hypothetical protein
MDSMLIVLVLPEIDGNGNPSDMDYFERWKQLCSKVRGIVRASQDANMLGQNVFLLPAKTQLPAAVEILGTAKTFRIPYQVLYLNEPLQWAETPAFR